MTSHPAWVEVDLGALVENAGVLRRAIPAGVRLGLLVKADAYGHGLEMAARAGVAAGADQLMVSNLDEGLAIRRAGLDAPVLVVYPIPTEDLGEAVEAGLELTVSGLDSARRTLEAWTVATRVSAGSLVVHVEIDTGMGRGGVGPGDLVDIIDRIEAAPATRVAGLWSHVASAADPTAAAIQRERFDAAVARVAATGRRLPARHLATTDGLFAGTVPPYELVRIGLGYYGELGPGLRPAPALASLAAALRPAMAVRARPVRVEVLPAGATVGYGQEWTADRPSRIATLPIGYADGWTRAYWPGASAIVRGRRVPLVGRVSMDSVCADVTDVGEVTAADVHTLLGADGDERVTAGELARLRGSIPNEVLCDFGPRLPRVYLEAPDVVAAVAGRPTTAPGDDSKMEAGDRPRSRDPEQP